MKFSNPMELKTYIFSYEEESKEINEEIEKKKEIAFVRENRGRGAEYQISKLAVMAAIRKKKVEHVILKYNIEKTPNLNTYRIYQKDGCVTIHIHPLDPYNHTLQSILNRQNMPNDEVYVTIRDDYDSEQKKVTTMYQMRHSYTEETKESSKVSEVFEKLVKLKYNCMIDHVVKTGEENLRYDFYTKDKEVIHIYVNRSHLEIVRKLDEFCKETVYKKQGLKKLIATGCIGITLLAGIPAVIPIAKDFIISQHESMEKVSKIETNMRLIQSYHARLGNYAYGLTSSEFSHYQNLVEETLLLLDESDASYAFLKQCREEIDNAYSSSPTSRYKIR